MLLKCHRENMTHFRHQDSQQKSSSSVPSPPPRRLQTASLGGSVIPTRCRLFTLVARTPESRVLESSHCRVVDLAPLLQATTCRLSCRVTLNILRYNACICLAVVLSDELHSARRAIANLVIARAAVCCDFATRVTVVWGVLHLRRAHVNQLSASFESEIRNNCQNLAKTAG